MVDFPAFFCVLAKDGNIEKRQWDVKRKDDGNEE